MRWTYQPNGKILSEFIADDSFVSGIRGPIGSGKSTACVMKLLKKAQEQAVNQNGKRRTRWAVIRNTYPELKTTTIKTWHQWVGPEIGKWKAEGPPTHFIQIGEIDMEVLFIALDSPGDVNKLLSLELTGAWINEARELPKAVLDALTGRVGRFPARMDGGATWSGIFMDTNPPDDDHWWYTLAEIKRPQQYAFFSQPSGLDDGAENRANLPQNYYTRAVLGKKDEWVKVYVHGRYGFVREGKAVYNEYNDSIHCKPIEFDPNLDLHIGADFGLTPAAVFMQRALSGQVRFIDELVTENFDAVEFGIELNAKVKRDYLDAKKVVGTGDPAGDHRAPSDKTTCFEMLNAQMDGVHFEPASTNDPGMRHAALASSMKRLVMGGEPGFVISPKCVVTRKGLAGGYCFKRLQVVGADRFMDKPDKNKYSHPVEAGEYGTLGMGEGDVVLKNLHRVTKTMHGKIGFDPLRS